LVAIPVVCRVNVCKRLAQPQFGLTAAKSLRRGNGVE
jgi:hypothetical protein